MISRRSQKRGTSDFNGAKLRVSANEFRRKTNQKSFRRIAQIARSSDGPLGNALGKLSNRIRKNNLSLPKDGNMLRSFLLTALILMNVLTVESRCCEASDFIPLVAEASLEGWTGDLDSWKVVDGTLIGKADGTLKANRFIVADIPPVANFELIVDVWVSNGGNSGLQYRSEKREDLSPFAVAGYQCDVVSNNPDYNGMLYEEKGRRILSHTGEVVVVDTEGQPWVTNKLKVHSFAPEKWHTYRVLVEGNHHRHWIDDMPTADLIDLDEKGRRLTGVLGVQVHVGPPMEVRYRNMRLRRLPDDLPLKTAKDAPIPNDAVKVVPQGGWKKSKEQN